MCLRFLNFPEKLLLDYSTIILGFSCFLSPSKKWYLKDTKLSIFPVGSAKGIITKNLQYNLNNESLTLPNRTGSSNKVAEDGFIEISYLEGHLLLMECWD